MSADNSVTITPCEHIGMRIMDVRIPWEPSSFVEESDRKNIFFELRDPSVRAYLQDQEEALAAEGWGAVNSCLAKEGLLRCKINLKQVHLFDKDRHATNTPPKISGLCVQRNGEAHWEVADTRRQRVRPEFAGIGHTNAPTL